VTPNSPQPTVHVHAHLPGVFKVERSGLWRRDAHALLHYPRLSSSDRSIGLHVVDVFYTISTILLGYVQASIGLVQQ
jgi:hypothetical protein